MRTLAAIAFILALSAGCAGHSKCAETPFADREWPENCEGLTGEERDYCLEAQSETRPPQEAHETENLPGEEEAEPAVPGETE